MIKEYDLASWQRKWLGCIALFEGGDKQFIASVNELEQVDKGGKRYYYAKLDPGGTVYLNDGPEGAKEPVVSPVYHNFSSGVYHMTTGDWCVVARKHRKLFSCGVAAATFDVLSRGSRLVHLPHIDWLKPITPMKYNPDLAAGYLDKRLWWIDGRLMYLLTQIGFIRADSVHVNHNIYVRQLRKYVGEQCKINVL